MNRNYDKRPYTKVEGTLIQGWEEICKAIEEGLSDNGVLAIECYQGIHYDLLRNEFANIEHSLFIDTATLFKSEVQIQNMTDRFVTADVLFGYMTDLDLIDYFDSLKLAGAKKSLNGQKGRIIVFGYGASLVLDANLVIYADMPRWEIQQRMRRKEVNGLGVRNHHEDIAIQYKRGLFNDWKVCDKHKRKLYDRIDYWLDTVSATPKMIGRQTFFEGLSKTVSKPFRVVPFFDPAPWGGQWMKEVCNLDRSQINYGWCFDCVPEENSLLFQIDGVDFEMPAINVVFSKSEALLGEKVEARFGKEFPIRFDFLDTMGGGNLSLQVHPTTQYIQEKFGVAYTQDESYYLLDAEDDACVYLGLKQHIDNKRLIEDLEVARENENFVFDAEKYINKFPAKKHDHFLIPAGTIHCSGKNSMVLEISATPFIYTFKLWDWQRMGLDGKPRPNNVHRGKEVINWHRDTNYALDHLINKTEVINEGDGWMEERTGLHPSQFIETRRHSFTTKVLHHTAGTLNVLNLVEGEEAIVESPTHAFEPFIVHYAETFIVPACVGAYTIKPFGASNGKACKTIKAFVRTS